MIPGITAAQAGLTAGDQYFANVSSLLHGDGTNGSTTITDVKGKTWTAAGNAQISTAQKKYGTGAILLDGAGDYIGTPNVTDFDFGSNPFTIDMFVRFNTVGQLRTLMNFGYNANNGWALVSPTGASTGALRFAYWQAGQQTVCTEASGFNVDQWYHISVVRAAAGAIYIFRDGAVSASGTMASPTLALTSPGSTTSNQVVFGGGTATGLNGQWVDGYMDEIRITKGVARYTSSFTVPASAYPDSA